MTWLAWGKNDLGLETQYYVSLYLKVHQTSNSQSPLSVSVSVSTEVNVSRCQLLFNSLVSVDVQVDQLISQVLQDKLLLAPTPRCHENKAADGPSLFHFMGSDLLRQKPLPPEEEPVNADPCPLIHHAHSNFDLYGRQRRNEATPWRPRGDSDWLVVFWSDFVMSFNEVILSVVFLKSSIFPINFFKHVHACQCDDWCCANLCLFSQSSLSKLTPERLGVAHQDLSLCLTIFFFFKRYRCLFNTAMSVNIWNTVHLL